jgi:hypothetical protein
MWRKEWSAVLRQLDQKSWDPNLPDFKLFTLGKLSVKKINFYPEAIENFFIYGGE